MKLEKSKSHSIKKKRKTDEENEGNRKKVKSGTHKERKDNDIHKKHKSSPKHSNSRSSHKSSKKPEINSCKANKPEVDSDTKANGKENADKERGEELQDENNNMNVMKNGQSENKDYASPENVLKTEISEDFNETSTKNQAKVKGSDNGCPSLIAVKEEDEVPSLDHVSNKTDPKEKKEKKKVKKEAVKDGAGNLTKDKLQGQKNKRNSSTTEDEQKKKKKAKKEKDEDKEKPKEKKETKKEEEEASKWKWWEERKLSDGQKWSTFEHKGPYFPPEYEPLPTDVSFLYDENPMKLSLGAEEVATFYAKMLDHEYTTKEIFQNNFFTDWQEIMTEDERKMIKKLSKCDFSNIHQYFLKKTEEKKNLSKEEKQVLKEEANKLTEEYGYCFLDGHKEKIGNFRIEPPGLFRGRGEHPKMGKLKRRVQPEDVIINCSEDSAVPLPPAGHCWKRVQHDNTVTWLASWVENIHGHIKYIMLNPSSKLKGEKDWQKYETARNLKLSVNSIRSEYRNAWTSREMKQRQRGVALYFIDKLALRAGNEKDDDTADTVGCCSLRVEHITLHKHLDDKDYVVEFDFLGKDSIRYYNKVPVEKQVFKNLKLFMKSKDPEDDLFDRISTIYLNKKLNEAMPGLTAKVFRTYNASTTLQDQLSKLTTDDMTVEEKILAYNRANRAVAILCNHQRAAPKTFEKSMLALQEKIKKKIEEIDIAKKELKEAKKAHKENPSEKSKNLVEKKEKALKRLSEQLKKLQLQETDREENKVIALGTSKLNYLDPRITVAWCKKNNVPVEKIYNKTHRAKFAWAIDMADENFKF